MNLQPFLEAVLAETDKMFETEANNLLNSARVGNNHVSSRISGRMDGISDTVIRIKKVYETFTTNKKSPEEDTGGGLYGIGTEE